MTFPNAYHGVKKVFTAEILSTIAAVLSLIIAIVAIVSVVSLGVGDGEAAVTAGLGTAGLLIAAGIIYIISYIMSLVGLYQAGKDEGNFKTAFYIMIFTLILAVITGVINAVSSGNGIADNITTAFSEVARIIVFVLVIQGVSVLADKLKDSEVYALGSKILIVVVIMYGISLVAKLIPVFFGISATSVIIEYILDLIAAVFSFVAFIIYLVYLGKAKNMLMNK